MRSLVDDVKARAATRAGSPFAGLPAHLASATAAATACVSPSSSGGARFEALYQHGVAKGLERLSAQVHTHTAKRAFSPAPARAVALIAFVFWLLSVSGSEFLTACVLWLLNKRALSALVCGAFFFPLILMFVVCSSPVTARVFGRGGCGGRVLCVRGSAGALRACGRACVRVF